MNAADILDKAADLIEPEDAWTQRVCGRDKAGTALAVPSLDRAVCFCATGAIWKAAGLRSEEADRLVMGEIFPLVQDVVGWNSIGTWNDAPGRTQAEVVAKLREAAEKAREQGL